MKRFLATLPVCLALAACGSHGASSVNSKQVQGAVKSDPNTAKAEAVAKACVSKGGGWKAEYHCAVPKGHGAAFLKCVLAHKPANVHNQAADVKDLEDCGVKYR